MRKPIVAAFGVIITAVMFPSLTMAQSVWKETFETYSLGPWAGQGGWAEWTTGVSGDVVNTMPLEGTQCGYISGASPPDDMVFDFSQLPGGVPGGGAGNIGMWASTVNTYVPSSAAGTCYIQWLNDYPLGGGSELSVEVIWPRTLALSPIEACVGGKELRAIFATMNGSR